MSPDVIGALVGFLLTLMVFSYLIGDNPLYRIAVNLFVGAVAGYVVLIATINALIPQLFLSAIEASSQARWDQLGLIAIGWVLVLLLVIKFFRPQSNVGRIPLAFLVGLGAAVAVGGAVTGTLFPQTAATFVPFGGGLEQLTEALVLVFGTVCTLAFFFYTGRSKPDTRAENPVVRFLLGPKANRPMLARIPARIGQIFIGIAFGVMYAGTLAASVAFFAERVNAILSLIGQYVQFN